MPFGALSHASHFHLQNPNLRRLSPPSTSFTNNPDTRFRNLPAPSRLRISPAANGRRHRLKTLCKNLDQEVPGDIHVFASENGANGALVSSFREEDVGRGEGEEEAVEVVAGAKRKEFAANQSILNQMKEIVMFSGPATALWICGPLMSLIDTAMIGRGSSLELAALGPATVFCDYTTYVFMFLSIATSNMVATALTRQDKKEVQHQISILLFVGLACGVLMLFSMKFLGAWALTAFTGPKNAHLVPAANTYVQIRGLAWPAILVGLVAQSASLGMKDSWGPLKALAVATAVNVIGLLVLCTFLGYGIAGAACATMASQVIASYMMIQALNKKGYSAYSISVPSPSELLQIFKLAAPVFVTMVSKVSFYSLIIYFATSMGTQTVAAHQVMIQMYSMCTVWGEPLSQTAQSFMPELMYGVNRSLPKAQTLLKSLLIIGVILGSLLGIVGTALPGLFPNIFTPDPSVMQQMRKVLIPFFFALAITPCTHSLEGTLLAGRDLKFLSFSMSGCFILGAIILWLVSNFGYGLPGCWCALVGFQWIQRLAWPAILVGWVAQSASLALKDSWGPLKALAVSSAINGIGDIVLYTFLCYGIASAAWATMVSQVAAGYMMIEALNKKGYNAFAFSVPSLDEFVQILGLAAPVFVTMMPKARMLLKSLLIMGALIGLTLGTIAIAIPWLFPNTFTHDDAQGVDSILSSISGDTPTHSLEGTLPAGRELRFISLSMSGCFSFGGLLLLFVYSKGYWFGLVAFQWARFFLALR